MKKIGILVLSLIVLIAIKSCTIEDDDISPDNIQGTWRLIAEAEGGLVVNLENCELEETIVFLQNTGTLSESTNNAAPCTFDTVPFNFSSNNNSLSITIIEQAGAVTFELVIDQLTDTNLSVRVVSDSQVGLYDPADVISQTFVRQ